VLAVRANHTVTVASGRTVTAAGAVRMIPARAWQRMRTGSGTKGTRHYDWAMLEVASDDTPGGHPGGHSVLLVRRHRYTGTLSYYRCWTPGPVPLSKLIAVASARWRIEDGHRCHRSSCVVFSWLCSLFLVGLVFSRCPAGAGVVTGRAGSALV